MSQPRSSCRIVRHRQANGKTLLQDFPCFVSRHSIRNKIKRENLNCCYIVQTLVQSRLVLLRVVALLCDKIREEDKSRH